MRGHLELYAEKFDESLEHDTRTIIEQSVTDRQNSTLGLASRSKEIQTAADGRCRSDRANVPSTPRTMNDVWRDK